MRTLFVLLACSLGGCGSPSGQPQAMTSADTVAVDRARCILPVGVAPSDSVAAKCAELFVARNGYTDLPPVSDSMQWTPTFMEMGIRARRGMLERQVYALCGNVKTDSVVLAVFRPGPTADHPKPAQLESGQIIHSPQIVRALEMRSDLSVMRLIHQGLLLPNPKESGCWFPHAAPRPPN